MIKKSITYTDFNGSEVTEDFYFHMTDAEILKLECSEKGGLTTIINNISHETDPKIIFNIFERVIRMAYGRRSLDGSSFLKKPEYADAFLASEAYSQMFMEFMQNPDSFADFFKGLNSSVQARTKNDRQKFELVESE